MPNVLADRTVALASVPDSEVPTFQQAVQLFINTGGHLTMPSAYGPDPLGENDVLCDQRQRLFCQALGVDAVFSDVISGGKGQLRAAILYAIELSLHLRV